MLIYPISCSRDLKTLPGECQGSVPSDTGNLIAMSCDSVYVPRRLSSSATHGQCTFCLLLGDMGLICYQVIHKARLYLSSTGPECVLCISIY